MIGKTLKDWIQPWSSEKLAEFLECRRQLLTAAPGNICVPNNGGYRWAPFDQPISLYKHAPLLGDFMTEYGRIMRIPPADVISPNPYAASKRASGRIKAHACWDAAVGIPASKHRATDDLPEYGKVQVLRRINTTWSSSTLEGLHKVGPTTNNGFVIRPAAPWLIDLQTIPFGWELIEMAHVLAHMRTEPKMFKNDKTRLQWAPSMAQFRKELAKLVIASIFGIPIDVKTPQDVEKLAPDISWGGIEVAVATDILNPVMRVPVYTGNSPIPDKSVLYIDAGVFVEPHPQGWSTGSLKSARYDMWSGLPTMVVLAGWETVEYVTHAPIYKGSRPKDAVTYALSPVDLMPMDTLPAMLKLAANEYSMPVETDTEKYPLNWLADPGYMEYWMRTYPLPCPACQMVNSRSIGAPERPKMRMPKPGVNRGREYEAWKIWMNDLKQIRTLVESEILTFESRRYGYKEARRLRKRRKAACEKYIRYVVKSNKDTNRKKRIGGVKVVEGIV